jgi:muramoyltetrapeptide carboxypeptidase LdcA involved in peptidoglycan recycling
MIRTDNQCLGKVRYDTKEQAGKAAVSMNKMKGRRLVAYDCPVCHGAHIGHESKGKKLYPNNKSKTITYNHPPGIHLVDISKVKKK